MLEGLLNTIAPVRRFADRLEETHPIFSMLVFQTLVSVLLISAVGVIALAGGGVIWIFYHMIGAM